MSIQRKVRLSRKRRSFRTRSSLTIDSLPRVSIFRSLQHIYAQLIDDKQQKTIASFSCLGLKTEKKSKKEIAFEVGKGLAQKARAQGVEAAVFDRGRFLFHGRVKSVAEGLREGGLDI